MSSDKISSPRRGRSPLSTSISPGQSTDSPLLAAFKTLTDELALCRQEVQDLREHVNNLRMDIRNRQDEDWTKWDNKWMTFCMLKGYVHGFVSTYLRSRGLPIGNFNM